MKKNKYIQPAIESVMVQHISNLCDVSLYMNGDVEGGTEEQPIILNP